MVIKHEYGTLHYIRCDGFWYIASIYVHPDHRGEGIGTWLMKTALSQCVYPFQPVLLYATDELGGDIERLRKFYRKFGFKAGKTKIDTFPYRYNMVLIDE